MTGTRSSQNATASRVRAVLQLTGGLIAFVQGVVLPLLQLPNSVTIFVVAAGMAGISGAASLDARRREKARDSGS